MALTEPKLADGEAFVPGRNRARAAELLELAAAAGFESGAVKTTSFGYIVPASILEESVPDAEKTVADDTDSDADAAAADAEDDGEDRVVQFSPVGASIAEVKEYLADTDDTERERVLAVEAASEKPRKGILDLAKAPEGAK